MKIRLAITLGLLHLALVVLGATEPDLSAPGIFRRLVRYYGSLSGSGANYSFFAPSVGSPLRATFYLSNEKGESIVEGTDFADRELSLRLGNIVDAFRDKLVDKTVRRSIAASWSGLALTHHPSSTRVRFVLDEYRVPTMKEFNEGARMGWSEDYSATFERRRKMP